jgi:tetratricopeptide (TPR) repeat protein
MDRHRFESMQRLARRLGRLVHSRLQAIRATQPPHPQPMASPSWDTARELLRSGQWLDALAALDQLLVGWVPDAAGRAEALFRRAYALERLHRMEEAVGAYEACQKAEENEETPEYRHLAAFRQGNLLVQLSRWDEAITSLLLCDQDARHKGLPELRMNALRLLVSAHQFSARATEALGFARQLAEAATKERDFSMLALALDVEGDLLLGLGEVDAALHLYERSLDLFRSEGNEEAAVIVRRDIASLFRTTGKWDNALRWLQVCLQDEDDTENWSAQAHLSYDLGCLYIHGGDLLRAGGYLQHSLALFREAGDRAGADLAGRTLLGLGVVMHRQATADWLTASALQRGASDADKDGGKDDK